MPTGVRIVLCAALPLFLCGGCSIDHGLGEFETRITGRVIFSDLDKRPAYAGQARVVAVYQFPPTGLGDVLQSNILPAGRDTADFEILAQKGTYAALGVIWRHKESGWNFANLIGLYTKPNSFSLQPVTVSDEQPVASNIEIFATGSLALRDARIEGDITFAGDWPADTELLGLIAFPNIPDLSNADDLIQVIQRGSFDITVPTFVQHYRYRLTLANGTYKFLGLFWKGTSTPFNKIRPIGFYALPGDPTRPAEIILPENGVQTEVNFVADFRTLPDGVPYEQP